MTKLKFLYILQRLALGSLIGAVVFVLGLSLWQQIELSNQTHPVTLYAVESGGQWYPSFTPTGGAIPAITFQARRPPYLHEGMEVVKLPNSTFYNNAGLVLLMVREDKIKWDMDDTRGALKLGIITKDDVDVVKQHTGIDIGETNGIGVKP